MGKVQIWSWILLLAAGAVLGQEEEWEAPVYGGQKVAFVLPVDGQQVTAGDSLTIEMRVEEGIELTSMMVVFTGGGLVMEPPYRKRLWIDESRIGAMELTAMAFTTNGEMITAPNISVVIGTGEASLVSLSYRDFSDRLYGPGSIASLTIYGEYSDGVRRDLTDLDTYFSVADGSEFVCVTDEGVVIGKAPGEAVIFVEHGEHEVRIPVKVGDGQTGNNPPHVDLASEYVGVVGEELCFDDAVAYDFDACIGEPLNPDQFNWSVMFESVEHQGSGQTFCFTPHQAGHGVVRLQVVDMHGASSMTMASIMVD